MASLLAAVKSKMYVFAHRKALGMLDGEYASVFRGRSLDFDDLRAYVPGDEVRDIDWRATARTGAPLVKRYEATRRQRVVFLTDTGRNMAASARGGEEKKHLVIMAVGVIGSLALGHGDCVSLVSGSAQSSTMTSEAGTERHLERLLQSIDEDTTLDSAQSDLLDQLEYAAAHIKMCQLMVIIADQIPTSERLEKVLRRLCAQHELLWLQIDDAELISEQPQSADVVDVAGVELLLSFMGSQQDLFTEYAQNEDVRAAELAQTLKRRGIAMAKVGHSNEVVGGVFELLERHRRAR